MHVQFFIYLYRMLVAVGCCQAMSFASLGLSMDIMALAFCVA